MNKVAGIIGDKVGDIVEDAVKGALGIKDKEDKKKGGFMSNKGNKGKEEKKKDGDKGFFSKIFHKDDHKDEGLKKTSGFQGLFSEGGGAIEGGGALEGAGAMEGGGAMGGGEEAGGSPGQTVAVSDRDLLDDLVEVAEETSTT